MPKFQLPTKSNFFFIIFFFLFSSLLFAQPSGKGVVAISDGTTTVYPYQIDITSGGTVTDGNDGTADLAISGGTASFSSTSPQGVLYISQGNTAASSPLIVTNGNQLTIGAGTTQTQAALFIRGSGTGTGFALRIADTTPTDRLVVLDDGNVGIGITAPTQLLDVSGTANATTITEGGNAVFNSTEVPGGELGGTWASPTVDATHSGSAHHSAVTMSGVPDYITLSGQDIVRAKLDISDDTNATGGTGIGITANDLTFVATELSALTWSAGGSAQFSWDWNLSAGDPKINFNNNSINIETGNLGVGLTNPVALLQVGTSPTPGLVVTVAGNVGIANTAPIALLQVGTSPNVGLMVISSGNVGIGTSLPIGLLQVGTSPGTAGLTVTGGNVGVGTTSPTAKLEIIPANTSTGFYLNIAEGKLMMKSPDGTCSACSPNNSDVWACASATCPP